MRQPLVAGNWKMNGSRESIKELLDGVKAGMGDVNVAEVAVCSPAIYISDVQQQLEGSAVAWGGQDLSFETSGAFTGETAASMLLEFGCKYVIIGHSERRAYHGETDEQVARKYATARAAGLVPILCVGETLEEREGGITEEVVARQLDAVISRRHRTKATTGVSLAEVREQIDESLTRIRRFIQYLRPPILEYLGLVPALRELVDQIQREAGIRVSMETARESCSLNAEMQLLVFRIVQEALRNVQKHSCADRCSVRIEEEENLLQITIEDDGIGFSYRNASDLVSSGKLGLMGMEERAHLLGGTLNIHSSQGRGTTVELTLPEQEPGSGGAGTLRVKP